MPRFDGTGPTGQGAHGRRGMGRYGGQGLGAGGSPMGGGRRRLRKRNGMGGTTQPPTSLPDGALSIPTQQSGLLASGQEVTQLKQQVQQLTEMMQTLTQKLTKVQQSGSPKAESHRAES